MHMLSLRLNDKKIFNMWSFKPCAIFYSVHSNYDFISIVLKNLIFQRSIQQIHWISFFNYFDLSLTISGNNYYLQNASWLLNYACYLFVKESLKQLSTQSADMPC